MSARFRSSAGLVWSSGDARRGARHPSGTKAAPGEGLFHDERGGGGMEPIAQVYIGIAAMVRRSCTGADIHGTWEQVVGTNAAMMRPAQADDKPFGGNGREFLETVCGMFPLILLLRCYL